MLRRLALLCSTALTFPAAAQTLTWSQVTAGQLAGHTPLPQCSAQSPAAAGSVTWSQINGGLLCSTTATAAGGPAPGGAVTWSQVYAGQLCAYEPGSLCPSAGQTITSVALSGTTFDSAITNAPVGTAAATLSPASPAFSGTWSITNTGTDAAGHACNASGTADFTININTGAVQANGLIPAGSYTNVCVTATKAGLTGSPYTQATNITGVPVQVVTVSSSGTACTANPVQYTTLPTAFNAIANNYGTTYDVQVCPGTYTIAGPHVDFNGTIEGMGTGTGTVQAGQVVLENLGGAVGQAMMILATENTPFPGLDMVIKNIKFEGTTTAGQKQPEEVGIQAVGVVQFDNDWFVDGKDGILNDPWTDHLNAGVVIISGSTFDNMCSPSGPSHAYYIETGYLQVGGPPGGTVTIGGTTYPAVGNYFGECNNGYNGKTRGWTTVVEGNTYHMNFVQSASAAMDDPDGGSLTFINNSLTFGPETGQTVGGNAGVAQAILIGGLIGQNLPASYLIQGNTMVLTGVTKPFLPVANLLAETNVQIITNAFPSASALGSSGILQGLGTIGSGNTYANGSPVTPVVQNNAVANTALLPGGDFRGTSGPKSVTLTGNTPYTVWGGNGVLTAAANGQNQPAIIGGPGGLVANQGTLANSIYLAQTDPGSPGDTLNMTAQAFPNVFSQGANTTVNMISHPGDTRECDGNQGGILNSMGGTVTVAWQNPAHSSNCSMYAANGGNLVDLNQTISTGTNAGNNYNLNGGGTVEIGGLTTRPSFNETDSTVIAQNLTIQPAGTAAPMMFNFSVVGGGVTGGPTVVVTGGTVSSVSGWTMDGYESAYTQPVIRLLDTASVPYTLALTAGGTVYAGVDKVTISGSTRNGPPTLGSLILHTQTAAAGSTIGGLPPLEIFADGPGTVEVNRTASTAFATELEIDAGGSGSIEVAQPWRTQDECFRNGATIATAGTVGSSYIITFTNGGTVNFLHPAVTPACNPGAINLSRVFTPITNSPSYALIFDDEFNGSTLDTAGNWFAPVNQADNTYSGYSPSITAEMLAANVSVHDGCLDLQATQGPTTPGNATYGSAAVTTRLSTVELPAYWEARIKLSPNAYGLADDYWTDRAPSYNFPEIDFSEYWANNVNQTNNNWNDGSVWQLEGRPAIDPTQWHVIQAWWTGTAITFYIDGVQSSQTTANVNQPTVQMFATILNNAICSQSICGAQPNGSTVFPSHFYVDYVHAYSAASNAIAVTPQSGYLGPGNATGNTTCP